ncbi:MAG: EipA family protein [Rhodomicrobium sp.]
MHIERKGWTMKLGYAAAIAMIMAFPTAGTAAQQCDARSFGIQIDQTAQALRTLNRESEKRFHERLEVLGNKHGWTDAQKADKAAAAMDDNKLESFNSDIEELAGQLDALSATPNSEVSCARLSELRAVQEKLIAVMAQKSGFILAQLEAEGGKAPVSPYAQQAPLPATAEAPASEQAAPQEQPPQSAQPAHPAPAWSVNIAQAPAQPHQAAAPLPLKPAASPPDARVSSLTKPPGNTVPPAPASDPVSPPPPASGYTADEIRNAGQGFFGSLTSEFALLVNHSFKKYGQPNAYIIGDEGGGAFLAGLRYGDGKLYTRLNGVESGPTHIYWQGPSFGADLGATGSRALFLVYNLDDPATLYKRFPGIDGSAYAVGGWGLTVYRSGNTLIVPIRTGLGLRLGASIAYLKCTERASLNPF